MPHPHQPDLFATSARNQSSVFLGWDRPLCELAADYLAGPWSGGTLDLTGILVIVPTRQSGRKLRESLAKKISSGGGAVVPPTVVTPDSLAASHLTGIAEPAEVRKAWVDVLTSINLSSFPALFPVEPPDRSFHWALHTAADLIKLRQDLGENGLLISDAAPALKSAGIEPERWDDLSALERKFVARLREVGLIDPQSARRDAAARPDLIPNITRVILLGTPDPSPLAIRILENFSLTIPVEVAIYAPKAFENDFDPWGRPEKIRWNSRPLDIPYPDASIAVSASPREQATSATASVSKHHAPPDIAAIGIGDTEIIPHLRQSLLGIGVGTFDPAGTPAAEHPVTCLLRHLRDLLESGAVQAFANLLRSADILDTLRLDATTSATETGAPFDPIRVLRQLDDLTNHHLPDTLDDLAEALSANPYSGRSADLRFALAHLRSWIDRFHREDLGLTLPDFLGWAFSAREFRADRPDDAPTAEIARLISASLDAMDGDIFSSQVQLRAPERLDLLLHLIATTRITTERRHHDIVLQGWLELLWEDASHLVLTGFNEGKIPESILGDHYLPDSARSLLGMRDNEGRFARDAYLLTALIESRRHRGRVEFLVGTASQSGDPLRPSRLLFLCPPQDLPHRALQLFRTPDSNQSDTPARTFPWRLTPPPPSAPDAELKKISVTAFASYLACPFRFFLRHNLRMREVEVGKLEMNPADFGTVIHEVLRRFGDDAGMRDCQDPAAIEEFLLAQARRIATLRFGRNFPVPILIQLESAFQRLRWVAEKQASLRADGWRIEHVEWKFGHEENPWLINGFPVTGSIDRIDRHLPSGAVRIIDYKTGSPARPDKDHLAPAASTSPHDWEFTQDEKGKTRRWNKLQLPLYLLAARELMGLDPDTPTGLAYFHIPKSQSGCGIDPWENLGEPTLQDAARCARGIIAQIKQHVFWPPRSVPARFDDFSPLLFGDPEKAVDPTPFLGAAS